LKAAGIMTLRGIAAGLNVRGIPTPGGKEWQLVSFMNALKRIGG
jgi:hypothetical protein